jgi:hypothetical protein
MVLLMMMVMTVMAAVVVASIVNSSHGWHGAVEGTHGECKRGQSCFARHC